jgi:FkbM family methyltransferase
MHLKDLKTFVQTRFPRLYRLARKAYFLPRDYWKPRSGSVVQILEGFCFNSGNSDMRFIQVGANNGNDEFAHLRKRYCWKGVMVEPQKDVFDELVQSNQAPGIAFEMVAIADQECEKTLYKISFSKAAWATGMASFDKSVMETYIKNGWIAKCAAQEGVALPAKVEDYYTSETVRCVSLKTLLEKHRITSLDVFIVDTEGHDYFVVKQIEHLSFRPRVVLFEHKNLPDRDFKACVGLLRSWGYRLSSDDSNTIGVRQGN